MYGRKVSMKLKPNTAADFNKRVESDVIPLLRKQTGFQEEIVFANADGKGALAISLWDRKESADAYEKNTYSQVKHMLESVIDGTPNVESYEVSASTLRSFAAAHTK